MIGASFLNIIFRLHILMNISIAKKTIVILFILSLFSLNSYSQPNFFRARVENMPVYDFAPYHFGFLIGINRMNFSLNTIDKMYGEFYDPSFADDVLPTPDSLRLLKLDQKEEFGFTVGIIGSLKLNKYFSLRTIPSLSFGERLLNYNVETFNAGFSADTVMMVKRIPSTYINLPLHLKYSSAKYNNFKMYVFGGFSYMVDLASLSKKRQEEAKKGVIVKLNRHDVAFEIGVGFHHYFSFFKFGLEAKMSYGLTDNLARDNNIYSQSIEDLRSKIFQLAITIE